MATHTEPVAPVPAVERRGRGKVVVSWLTTTFHAVGAADRLTRRGLPAAEHVLVLAVPLRRPDRARQLPHPAGLRRLRLDPYTPLSSGERTPQVGGDLWIMGLAPAGFGMMLDDRLEKIHFWTLFEKLEVDDPWGFGRSLEWATSCPPPRHNFLTLPKIRSESPAFDLRHPDVASLDEAANTGRRDVLDADGHKGERP